MSDKQRTLRQTAGLIALGVVVVIILLLLIGWARARTLDNVQEVVPQVTPTAAVTDRAAEPTGCPAGDSLELGSVKCEEATAAQAAEAVDEPEAPAENAEAFDFSGPVLESGK